MKTTTVCLILTLAACGTVSEPMPSPIATPTSGGNTTTPPASGAAPSSPTHQQNGGWTQAQSVAFMLGLDNALSDTWTFKTNPTTLPATVPTSVVSACAGAFASNGNISVTGTFTYPAQGGNPNAMNPNAMNPNAMNPNAMGNPNSFALKMNFNECALKASDQNTYVFAAQALNVTGTYTAGPDASGTLNNVFPNTVVTGTVTMQDANNASVQCDINVINPLVVSWSNNLVENYKWNGTICGMPMNGNVIQTLPVVVP